MTEKEIREILRDVMTDLDRRAARAGRAARKVVLPSMLGLGLAVSGCGDRAVSWQDGKAPVEAGVQQSDGATRVDLGYPLPPYMAPEYDSGVPNPTPEYAAPEPVPDAAVEPEPDAVPPPTPDYAAPMYGAPIPVEPDGGK